VDPAIEANQAARLAALRSSRDSSAVSSALSAVRSAAEGTDNVLPPMREALRARATVGEVCDTLREVWGLYRPASLSL
jgi:methylmalonyl-CoA mutase N-terminal domain/subunit